MTKITFHSGITSIELFDLLAKTLCQLTISKSTGKGKGMYKWILTFDKDIVSLKDLKKLDAASDEEEEAPGIVFKTQCRIGEEFVITVPITLEKAKVIMINW